LFCTISQPAKRHWNTGTCTIAWAIIFTLFWIAVFVIQIYGLTQGEPLKITNGIDMFGFVCGYGANSYNGTTIDLANKSELHDLHHARGTAPAGVA
jgi:hypothetical protein